MIPINDARIVGCFWKTTAAQQKSWLLISFVSMGRQTREANAEMCSVYDDVELLDWLHWAHETGPSFLQTIAEAAFLTDHENYSLLRPALLKLKKANPKPGQDV